MTPQNRGLEVFLSGIDDVTIQRRRDLMLGVGRDDLVELARDIYAKLENGESSKVVFGSECDDVVSLQAEGKFIFYIMACTSTTSTTPIITQGGYFLTS